MLKKSREFAIKAHGEQKYGSKPYIFHLEAVVKNLQAYGEMAQVIGYLHDVVEDTEITYEEVKENFRAPLIIVYCLWPSGKFAIKALV